MGDVLALVALSAAAAVVLVRRTTLPAIAITTAAPIAGLGLLSVIATVAIAVRHRLELIPVLAATVLVAVAVAIPSPNARRGRWWAVPAGGVSAGLIAWLAEIVPLTRLTPDSLDYLSIADILVEPGATASLRLFDLETRNLGTALTQSLAGLDGQLYSPGVTPAVVLTGLGFFAWALGRALHPPGGRAAWSSVLWGAGVLVALTAGRVVYDAFYVNSHGFVMIAFFAAAGTAYLARRASEPSWLVLSGLVCPFMMVARPEGPILVLVALAPALVGSEIAHRYRLAAAGPAAITGVVWFGLVVWRTHSDQVDLSPLDPTVGGVALAVALVLLAAAPMLPPLAPLFRWAPWALVIGLAGLAAIGFLRDRGLLEETVEATAVNLVGRGGWGLTWPLILALLVVAVMAPPIADERMLLPPVMGGLALFLASPVLRDAPYRVGAGDSGNRMLAHIVLVAILYVLVSAAESDSRSPRPIERIP